MSGKPNVEGVESAIMLMDKLQALDTEIEELNARVQRLREANQERTDTAEELCVLLGSMDLTAKGNFGYPARIAWFLTEMRRQTRGIVG